MPLPAVASFFGDLSGLAGGLAAPAASLTPQDRAALYAQVLQEPRPPNPRTPLEGVFDALNQGLRGRMMANALAQKETATKQQAATIADMLYGKAPQTKPQWAPGGVNAVTGDPNASKRQMLSQLLTQGVLQPSELAPAITTQLGIGASRPPTPQEMAYWKLDPKIPWIMEIGPGGAMVPKPLTTSPAALIYGGGSPGQSSDTSGLPPNAVPGQDPNSRFIKLQDGTQIDRLSGKTSQAPIGNNPQVDAGAFDISNPDYATKPVAGGLTEAAIDQQALNYLATGTKPPTPRTSGPAAEANIAITNRMAQIGGNPAANKAQYAALSKTLTQQTQYVNNIQRAFSTADTTLKSIISWMKQNNIDSSQFPDINSLANEVGRRGGDVGAIRGFQSQIAQLRSEYAMVLARGGQMNQTVEDQAAATVPDNISWKDLQTVADRLGVDSQNAITAANQQIGSIRQQLSAIGQAQPATTPSPVAPPVDNSGAGVIPYDQYFGSP